VWIGVELIGILPSAHVRRVRRFVSVCQSGRSGNRFARTAALSSCCLLQCRSFPGGPMAISMYQASVPVFIRMLSNLKNILGKGAAFAQSKKVEEAVLLNARLAA